MTNHEACDHISLESDLWQPPVYTCKLCGAFGLGYHFTAGKPFPAYFKDLTDSQLDQAIETHFG